MTKLILYPDACLVMEFNKVTCGEAAAYYAREFDWKVFPIYSVTDEGHCKCSKGIRCQSPGKHPLTKNGLKDGTTDPEQIQAWWQKNPDANVAIVTGQASGLVVIDIDLPNGFNSFERMLQEGFQLPDDTLFCLSGGGGLHIYLRHPGDIIVPNRTGFRPGIDIRGDGGYIIVPPSVHQSGKQYYWQDKFTGGSSC